ncbi:MAG: prepilin-type N-terminal cleavage/methylation domain-containing protein [Pirellulaceae bacterium]|nr:prepilin-type N-terminal cleavage/methylation domain-containing protein [Pirellulaceae bacterium]
MFSSLSPFSIGNIMFVKRSISYNAHPFSFSQKKRGFSLIELLVVVGIIGILIAISLPSLKSIGKDLRMRNSARQVSTYLETARNKAMTLGRVVGVRIERRYSQFDVNDPNTPVSKVEQSLRYSTQLSMVVAQPKYRGDSSQSAAIIDPTRTFMIDQSAGGPNGLPLNAIENFYYGGGCYCTAILTDSALLNSLYTFYDSAAPENTDPNDFLQMTIRFNQAGPEYVIVSATPPDMNGGVEIEFRSVSAPPPPTGRPLSFEITLPPKSSIYDTLTIGNTTAIDLTLSGQGATGIEFAPFAEGGSPSVYPSVNTNDHVIILFDPSGKQIRRGDFGVIINEPTHLCIGKIEQLGQENLNDPTNFWVSIHHLTGEITTTRNHYPSAEQKLGNDNTLRNGRKFALQGRDLSDRQQ